MITTADAQLYESIIQAVLIIPYSIILYRLYRSFSLESNNKTNNTDSIKLCAIYYYVSLLIWCILCSIYCICNYFIIKQIFDGHILKSLYYITFAVAIVFAYGSFDLFGYFIKIKLQDTYNINNTSLHVKSTFINIIFWITVASSIVAATTFILEYCITYWYPIFSSISNIILITRGQYLVVAEIYLCIIVFIFNHKLYQFLKLTNSNNKDLSIEINIKVKNVITKQTNLMSVMLIGSVMYNVVYCIYYIFYSDHGTADVLYETFFFLWQLTTSICIYLTFKFNDNQYTLICKYCHSFCLNICQRLVGDQPVDDMNDDFNEHLLIGNDQNSLQCMSISYASLESIDCDGNTKECDVVKTICNLLNQYNQSQTNVFEKYIDEQTCSIQTILDEFDHLLSIHDDPNSFHYIYSQLNQCKPEICKDYGRNTRDRKNVNEMEDEKHENNSIVQDIVGKIHSFYHHSYDALLRHNPMNKSTSYKPKTSISGINTTINGNNESNKFNSSLNIDENNESMHSLYSFGQRFEYEESKNEWFINPKYDSFKQELLKNKLAQISINQYDNEYNKCKEYMKSRHTKILKTRCENIKLSPSHILSLLIYCNCDNFQTVWSSTFRRIPYNETDKALKQRHSNFYFSSLNLRQLVEYFGDKLIEDDKNKRFYHGVSKILYFIRTNTQFNIPLSTSTETTVASHFSNNNGIILELRYSFSTFPLRARYFPCQFFSNYVNEKECLFIGGIPMMIITNIINMNNGEMYKKYINAINIINSLFNGTYKTNKNNTNNEQSAIDLCCELLLNRSIISNDKTHNIEYPQYIITLFNKYCINLKNIMIYWDDISHIQQFKASFSVNNNQNNLQFFDLNVILNLFPNIEQIEYFNQSLENTNKSVLKNEILKIWEYVTSFDDKNSTLKYIVIYHQISNIVATLQNIMENGWSFCEQSDKLILFKNNANIDILNLCFPMRNQGYISQEMLSKIA